MDSKFNVRLKDWDGVTAFDGEATALRIEPLMNLVNRFPGAAEYIGKLPGWFQMVILINGERCLVFPLDFYSIEAEC